MLNAHPIARAYPQFNSYVLLAGFLCATALLAYLLGPTPAAMAFLCAGAGGWLAAWSP